MDLRQGIMSTAQSLGIDPIDLATIISYETGGTLDPLQRGPTTKWGQHRGLIQFGEPQARQHGVDWDNPLASQLGPDGAVASYFRGSGAQPGMGLLDLYSIVNAGAPGRYNASDTAAGGAPGTVADKVRDQMHGHRAKAEQLIGSGDLQEMFAPQETPRGNTLTFPTAEQGGGQPARMPQQGHMARSPAQAQAQGQPMAPQSFPQGMPLMDMFDPRQGQMAARRETDRAERDRDERHRRSQLAQMIQF